MKDWCADCDLITGFPASGKIRESQGKTFFLESQGNLLWEDHTSKPSTNVLTLPKLGALREVARDNIFQKNLLASVLVCYSVTASPAQTIGPMTLIFETIVEKIGDTLSHHY